MPTASTHRSRGWTLVEMILATAIAVVVGLIVLTLFRAIATLRQTQESVREGDAALHGAAIQLVDDLTNSFQAEIEESNFRLLQGTPLPGWDQPPSMLGVTSYMRMPGETDLEWHLPQEVIWQVREESREAILERVTRPLSGPGMHRPVTNVVVRSLPGFHIQARNSKDWTSVWEPGEDRDWPREVRFRFEDSDDAPWTRVYLPTSMRIMPTIERGAAP